MIELDNFGKKTLKYLIVMAFLTPVGIFLPEILKGGDAWGEWDTETLKTMLGYVPKGLEKLSNIYSSIIPDYTVKGLDSNLFLQSVSYIISAFVGLILCYLFVYLIYKLVPRKT